MPIVLLAIVVTDGVALAQYGDSEALAEYLRAHGLHRLRVRQLEDMLGQPSSPRELGNVAAELATELLRLEPRPLVASSTKGPRARGELRQKIGELIASYQLPSAIAAELRLKTAAIEFDWLMDGLNRQLRGSAAGSEVSALPQSASGLQDWLQSLVRDLEAQARSRPERIPGAETSGDLRRTRLRHENDLLAARAMLGWTMVARAWLATAGSDGPSPRATASQAMPFLAQVLGVDETCSDAGEASVDLRGQHHYSDVMLAVAIGKGISHGWQDARPWFDLLTGRGTHPTTRSAAMAWQTAMMIAVGAPDDAQAWLRSVGGEEAAESALRVALASDGSGPSGQAMATTAITILAANGRWDFIQQAIPEPTGLKDSTANAYLHIARNWRAIRGGGGGGTASSSDPNRRAKCRELLQAVQGIGSGMKAGAGGEAVDPAGSWQPDAAAAARELAGWCQWELGNTKAAADEFAFAREHAVAAISTRAAIMELNCLARLGAPQETMQPLRLAIIDSGSDADGVIDVLIEFALHCDDCPPRIIDSLSEVEETHPKHGAAMGAASTILYRRFREARGEERQVQAEELLALAIPLSASWTPGAVDDTVRRQLDAALDPAVQDLDAAHELLDEVAFHGEVTNSFQAEEIAFRREQLALAESRWADALSFLGRIGKGSPYWAAGNDWIERAVVAEINAGRQSSLPADLHSFAANRLKSRAIALFQNPAAGTAQREAEGLALAEALLAYARQGQPDCGEAAITMMQRLIANQPQPSYLLLRRLADAALVSGDRELGQEVLSGLVPRLDPTSAEGAQARCELCELLAANAPLEALKHLKQQRVLVPHFGPDPWGERMAALHAHLIAAEVAR